MLNRLVALASIVVSASLLADSGASASKVKVGPLVPVSATDPLPPGCDGPNRDAEIEPTVAVNPRNPDRQVMAWMQGPSPQALTIVSANSSDGGQSWNQVLVPDNTQCTGGKLGVAIHPWLSYGPKGKGYGTSSTADRAARAPLREADAPLTTWPPGPMAKAR